LSLLEWGWLSKLTLLAWEGLSELALLEGSRLAELLPLLLDRVSELALLCWLPKLSLSLVLVDGLAEWRRKLVGSLREVAAGLLQAALVTGRLLYHYHWLRGLLHHHGLLGRLLSLSLSLALPLVLALTLSLGLRKHCHLRNWLDWVNRLDNCGLLVVSGS